MATLELYVAKTGDDSANSGLTISDPFLTIARALERAADFLHVPGSGATISTAIYIRTGTYIENIVSASQPFQSGYSPSEPPQPRQLGQTGSFPVRIQSYRNEVVTIRPSGGANVINLTLSTPSASNASAPVEPVHYVEFIRLAIDGANVTGSVVSIASGANNIQFLGCDITGGPSHGIQVASGCSDTRIAGNTKVHDNGGNGITDAGDNAVVEQSEIHTNTIDGVVISGSGGLIRLNDVHDNTVGLSISGANALVKRNRLQSNTTGFTVNGTGTLAHSNIVYSNTDGATGASGTFIDNNTFYNNSGTACVLNGALGRNNISFGNGTNSISGGSSNLDDGTDPLFVDAANSDFHLQSTSPAIDAGTVILPVTEDFDGVGRPQSGLYDQGALEFVPPGQTVALSVSGSFALGSGRACLTAPMDYRIVEATLKSFTGTPKSGIALAVDPASTSSAFTGYIWLLDLSAGHGVGDKPLKLLEYTADSLAAVGGVEIGSNNHTGPYTDLLGVKFNLRVGTNTATTLWDVIGYHYNSTNVHKSNTVISRSNLGFAIVGIGSSVSISISGNDVTVTTEDGTAVWTLVQAGCMNSPVNIAAFEETFTFNVAPVMNKRSTFNNTGFITDIDLIVKSHCDGFDCYGAAWFPLFNTGEVDPGGGDHAGDGIELWATYGGVVAGTPRSGLGWFIWQPFSNVLGTTYGAIVDEIDGTIKLVRWDKQSLQTYGTVLAAVPQVLSPGHQLLVVVLNAGSVRIAGDPMEVYFYVSTNGGSSFTEILFHEDITPYGAVVQAPNELEKWRNTNGGFLSVGTQSGNPNDSAQWSNFLSLVPLI